MGSQFPPDTGRSAPPTGTVFVVDDDDAVRDSLLVLLTTEGFTTSGFDNCPAALAAIAQQSPDCLVLDLHLPGMTGAELIKALGARKIALPVVMITGHIDRKNRMRAMASGADVVLHKPLDHAELLAAVHRACDPPPV
ncbi:MAG: response regulator [Alphaproteobacteria bacterium]|nr:response regulator [Alphaproteobacteria bacterium]